MKVAISRNLEWNSVDIYLYDDLPDGRMRYIEPVVLNETTKEAGTPLEPTLRLSRREAEAFMQAFADAFAKEGIKTQDQHRIDGELQATKQHLADMQKITMMFMEDQHGNA